MFVETERPQIRIKSKISENTKCHHNTQINQIKRFVTDFLETGTNKELQNIQQTVRYLCLEDQQDLLIEETINIFTTYIQKNMCIDCRDQDDWRKIVNFHIQERSKIQFLSEIFQQLEGRVRLGLFLEHFQNAQLLTLQSNQKVLQRVTTSFFEKVRDYRQQSIVICSDIQSFFGMCVSIGLFKILRGKYQLFSNDYYQQKRDKILDQNSWITLVENQINKQTKLSSILNNELDTVKTVKKQLIKETLPKLLEVVVKLIQQNDFFQLKLVWKYIKLVSEQASLQRIIQQNIQLYEQSLKKIGVEPIIHQKLKLLSICENCFENNRQINIKIETSFENIFSRESTLVNQMMAQYFIKILRSSLLTQNDQVVVFEMFKTNPSKDLLMEQYKDLLSKQILMGNQNLSSHAFFVSMVSNYSGNLFTKSLQTMLHDVWKQNQLSLFVIGKLYCKILNKHEWPKIEAKPLILPDQLTAMKQDFIQKYSEMKPNQELIWIHWLSDITIRVDSVQITVSEVQAAIIFYIAKAIRPMKKHQLAIAINTDVQTIVSALQPLKKINLIVSDRNQGLQICYDDIKTYNYQKQYHNPPKSKNNIITDRALTIEATIVRILKKKKILQLSEAINQVLMAVKRFKPTIEQINIGFKSLAAKEYVQIVQGVIKYKA